MATSSLLAGEPYFRPAGAEHDVVNANAVEFVFVEVELKAGRDDRRCAWLLGSVAALVLILGLLLVQRS